jgi:hypothetical protein
MTQATGGTRSTSHANRTTSRSTRSVQTQKKTKSKGLPAGFVKKIDLAHPPKGMNPALAAKVRAMGVTTDPKLQPGYPKKGTTHCNEAANKYAQQFGYKGFAGLNADKMNKLMSNPKSGWHKVTEAEAIKAAKDGKLVMESVPASAKHAHGHIAPVVGEFAPGKAGIAQAGSDNYEWGGWRRETPSSFVRD